MSANEQMLREFLHGKDINDAKEEAVDAYTAYLKSSPDYDPCKLEHMDLALVQMSEIRAEGFKELARDAADLGGEYYLPILKFIRMVSEEYWAIAARKDAEMLVDNNFAKYR